jgi:primosomal protein N' (replication factor Y)
MVPKVAKEEALSKPKVKLRQQWIVSLRDGEQAESEMKLSERAREVLRSLRTGSAEALREGALKAQFGARWKSVLGPLKKQGLLVVERKAVAVEGAGEDAQQKKVDSTAHVMLTGEGRGSLTPTDEQAAAIEGIARTLGTFASHLVWGITGSGKTEIYLRLIERVLQLPARADGAMPGAIVLVPEIALTPQTSSRFLSRFGSGTVAVLHSALSAKQRAAAWKSVHSGQARVVVGPRSAIFAPLARVDLVIVDEEHDGSYKQDQLPRYHGRDVAIKRAQLHSCPVVLGSATPSLESFRNATEVNTATGKARSFLWKLVRRASGAALPTVVVVDMREEAKLRRATLGPQTSNTRHLMGPTLERALEATLNKGEQAILLLNRRGVARRLHCTNAACGYVLMCDHCDSALVVHGSSVAPAGSIVKCHHCNMDQRVPAACPSCKGKLHSLHAGTQKLEDELERSFASMGLRKDHTLLRLDADSMGNFKDYFRALDSFARGEARVLVGTQMLAKGLDFPLVSLVGVLDADTSLAMPDFRSCERTFQLLSQVAGRAGRAARAGTVIVQTLTPHMPVIGFAQKHDFESFAIEELRTRREAKLPPYTRFAHIVCRDQDVEVATAAADTIASALRHDAEAQPAWDARIVGPAPCVLARVNDHYRVGIEVFCASAIALQTLLQGLRERGLLKSDAATAVDVDAVSVV